MSIPRTIGILGGMGPEATILLQQKVLAAVQARDDADHIPLLIDMNPQVPSRIAHLIDGDGPDPGPVLANTGLDNLRFMSPVVAGDRIAVQLTVKLKTRRTDTYGEVRWQVILSKQDNATVASYELLTMNAY